jgi:hypothetical protein
MTKIAVFLLLASSCMASTMRNETGKLENACPIVVDRSGIRMFRGDIVLRVDYHNVAPLKVTAVKFSLETMDPTNDFSDYFEDLVTDDKLAAWPSKNGERGEWTIFKPGEVIAGYRIALKKVAYSDGTLWIDDGTKKCQVFEDVRSTK